MQERSSEIIIKDELAGGKKINIKAFQLPILNKEILHQELNKNSSLKRLFESTRIQLKQRIEKIFSAELSNLL